MQPLEQQFERLKKASGVTSDTAFAEFLGISQGSISGAKKKQQIPHSWFFQVSDKTGVSSDWLFFGRGPMHPEATPQPIEAQTKTPPETPDAAGTCPRCTKLEAELEKEKEERRELSAELREVNADNRRLAKENGDLKAICAELKERQKHCCPDEFFKETQNIPCNNVLQP